MTSAKILIVEDEQPLRMVLARLLRSGGYDIATAEDAVSAISTAVCERPDLVLLDLGLPAGHGTLVLERLRNLMPTSVTPVIVLTGGFVDAARHGRLTELGCDVILTKPIAAEMLLRAVAEALDERLPSSEPLGV